MDCDGSSYAVNEEHFCKDRWLRDLERSRERRNGNEQCLRELHFRVDWRAIDRSLRVDHRCFVTALKDSRTKPKREREVRQSCLAMCLATSRQSSILATLRTARDRETEAGTAL